MHAYRYAVTLEDTWRDLRTLDTKCSGDEKDAIEAFANIFASLHPALFTELFNSQMPQVSACRSAVSRHSPLLSPSPSPSPHLICWPHHDFVCVCLDNLTTRTLLHTKKSSFCRRHHSTTNFIRFHTSSPLPVTRHPSHPAGRRGGQEQPSAGVSSDYSLYQSRVDDVCEHTPRASLGQSRETRQRDA